MKAAGATYAAVAQEFGISVRQAKRIVARDAAAPALAVSPLAVGGTDAIETVLRIHVKARADLAGIIKSSPHDSPRVAAIRTRLDAATAQLAILQAVGDVPRNLASPAERQQLQVVFREFAELLRRHDVGDDALRELLELADSLIGGRQRSRGGRRCPRPHDVVS
jgi:hypothetical protein